MKHLNSIFARIGVAAAGVLAPLSAFAVESPFERGVSQVGTIGERAGVGGTADLPTIVGRIINVALGFLGILLLVYLLYAGFLWMTAGGEEKKVTEAKQTIQRAIIGLIIIAAAFAISNFVLTQLVTVTR